MKFLDITDIHFFLIEIGQTDLIPSVTEGFSPSEEQIKLFIKKRDKINKALVDKEKSNNTKSLWRSNRAKMMKGIKRFHKSTKGKRFHRAMSRFMINNPQENLTIFQKAEISKAISSVKTHLYIELEYYQPIFERIETEQLVVSTVPVLNRIESKIFDDKNLSDNDIEMLYSLIEVNALIKSFADKTGKTEDEIDQKWNDIKKALKKQGHSETDLNFYGLLVSILKKSLKIS